MTTNPVILSYILYPILSYVLSYITRQHAVSLDSLSRRHFDFVIGSEPRVRSSPTVYRPCT